MSTATIASPTRPASQQMGHVRLTAAYFASFAALGLTTGLLGPTLPRLAAQGKTSLGAIGYIFTARSLGYVLAALKGGRLFERRTANSVMAGMLVAMAGTMVAVPLFGKLSLLLVLMVLLGVAEGLVDVGGNTLLVRVHGNRAGPYMNALHSFFGIGALLSPAIVAMLVSRGHDSLLAYPLIAGIPMALSSAFWRLQTPLAQPEKKSTTAKGSDRLVLLLAIFLFLYVGSEVSFGGWLFTYLIKSKLGDEPTAAYLVSGFWAALTGGRLLAIAFARRFRHRAILFADLAGCFVSLGMMLVFRESPAVALAGTLGLGLSMASIFPTTLAFASRHLSLTGVVTGRFIVGASTGSMLVPLFIGQVFEGSGPAVVLFVVFAALVLASITLLCAVRLSNRPIDPIRLAGPDQEDFVTHA